MNSEPTPTPKTSSASNPRWYPWAIAALIAVHVLLVWRARAPGMGTYDDAEFALLARSVAAGSYRDVWRVDAPVHSKYPPGYPVVLALWSSIAGRGFDALLLVGIASSAAAIWMASRIARRLLSPAASVAVVAAIAVNPHLVALTGRVLSEPFYAALALGAVLAGRAPTGWRGQTGAAFLAAGAALTRTIGISLFVALAAEAVMTRQWRWLKITAVTAALTLGSWFTWTVLAPEKVAGVSYVADAIPTLREHRSVRPGEPRSFMAVLARRLRRNVWTYPTIQVPDALSTPGMPGTMADNMVAAVTLAGALVAGLAVLWRAHRVSALYLGAYGAVLLVWPYYLVRFLLPILYLLAPVAAAGVALLASRWRAAWATPVAILFALVLALNGVEHTSALVRERSTCGRAPDVLARPCYRPEQRGYLAAVEYARDSVPGDALFIVAKAANFAYHTGRRTTSIDVALDGDPASLAIHLRETGTDYVLLDSVLLRTRRAFVERLHASCRALAVERQFPGSTALLRVPTPDVPGDSAACQLTAQLLRSEPADSTP